MYSIYSYPVDASCSFHYARDNIKSYIFFCALSSTKTIVYLLDGWFLLGFYYFAPTWNKGNNNSNNNNNNNNNSNNNNNKVKPSDKSEGIKLQGLIQIATNVKQ